jgi:dTDP-4-dehydrorhamnose 3,5-epimerase
LWKKLTTYHDNRGWLCELFRHDEVQETYRPVMSYISLTNPGVTRGPHEHVAQTDYFCFLGPGNFKVYLWDARPASPTYQAHQIEVVGEDNPVALIVPPGVVHAYRNLSRTAGVVFNCPNQLFKGEGRKQPVDEIRHEDEPNSPFIMA